MAFMTGKLRIAGDMGLKREIERVKGTLRVGKEHVQGSIAVDVGEDRSGELSGLDQVRRVLGRIRGEARVGEDLPVRDREGRGRSLSRERGRRARYDHFRQRIPAEIARGRRPERRAGDRDLVLGDRA